MSDYKFIKSEIEEELDAVEQPPLYNKSENVLSTKEMNKESKDSYQE